MALVNFAVMFVVGIAMILVGLGLLPSHIHP